MDPLFVAYLLTRYIYSYIHMMGRSEEGIYYSVDLGGTSFRVMKLELGSGSMVINKKVEHQPIPEDLTKGTSEVTTIIISV